VGAWTICSCVLDPLMYSRMAHRERCVNTKPRKHEKSVNYIIALVSVENKELTYALTLLDTTLYKNNRAVG